MNSSPSQKLIAEAEQAAEERARLQDVLVRQNAWQTCLNCSWWMQRTVVDFRGGKPEKQVDMICSKFNAIPPPHIIVSGCKDYDNDYIPF